MNQLLTISLAILGSYLLGSIPTSYIFGKILKGIDIREHGSGNAGATNALRILGTKWGILTMILDMAKGWLAVFLGRIVLDNPANWVLIALALGAIIGHIFTIYLGFKGGKGVATSAGVFIALAPIPVAIALAVFIITVWITRYVSLGSMLAALVAFGAELFINIKNNFADKEILGLVILIVAFIIFRHKANIQRLLAGNENKLKFKK